MRRLTSFTSVSLDGYFVDAKGDMSWAHPNKPDAEWSEFVANNAKGGGVLLFGRVTYELMASYWPTSVAAMNNPIVAERMNAMPKVVFSRTLKSAAWKNTTIVAGDIVTETRAIKDQVGENIAILGSGSVVSQLAQAKLIDEIQIVVVPVILGSGRTLFEGVTTELRLNLSKSRTFANGNVLMCYAPLA